MASAPGRLRALLTTIGRGLDSTAAVVTTLKHVLFVPLGLVSGACLLWQGQWLGSVLMLSVGVACLSFVADKGDWHHPWLERAGFVAVIVCICACVLLVSGEVLSPSTWWATAIVITTGGFWAARLLMAKLNALACKQPACKRLSARKP